MRVIPIVTFAVLVWGCEPPPPSDTTPPRLIDTEVSADGRVVDITFDEPVVQAVSAIDAAPLRPTSVEGEKVKIPVIPKLKPGEGHTWAAEVTDAKQNVTSVAGKFYPANADPATLRLNEIRVAGSGIHTDLVELRVEAPGSLGGWTVEVWSSPETHQRTVLPDVRANQGDFVVLRYKPAQGVSDSAPGAREYWQANGKGLPATKGLILLLPTPDGPPIDGVLYSKNPGEATSLAQSAGWSGSVELDPTKCTATRTWCRTDGQEPSWIVVTNGGATPGGPNALIAWEGKPSSHGGKSKTKG